jgi:hypothetical protein
VLRVEVATGEDGRNVLAMMKTDDPLEEWREAELPTGKQPSDGTSTPQKEVDFPELELSDEVAWEKERKTQRWHNFETP